VKVARELGRERVMLVNLSGRGDKDINSVREQMES
jgi:tryptophan synthase beta subunit